MVVQVEGAVILQHTARHCNTLQHTYYVISCVAVRVAECVSACAAACAAVCVAVCVAAGVLDIGARQVNHIM